MSEPEPVVEFRDVCFAYAAQEVLHNVRFRIGARDMVSVVGPNGGGKTTLLLLMLGLLAPAHGEVRVFGGPPAAARRRIGYVPQHMQFDPKFPVTAMDVVRMGRVDRRLAGRYRREDHEAALRALEQVGMTDLRQRPFSQLSGGQRQRILVAQALATEPEMLLLDEPTANVDAVVEHRLYELFRELNRTLTVVFVSHNVNVVSRHVSHVLCVNRTARLHPISEVMSGEIREAHGGDLALLLHDIHCHVLDASGVMASGHAAEAQEGRR